ncbi:MAG: hypothetical protein ACREPA_00535 [Candidatus Dormibacteraceae bacterium]
MRCEVCSAPALPRGGVCVFCHSPLTDGSEPPELLDYLAQRLPGADVRRSGLIGHRPVRRLKVEVGGEVFRARVHKGRLTLLPEMSVGAWVDRLLARVTSEAATDAQLRASVSQAGWAHRDVTDGSSDGSPAGEG